MSDDKTLVVAEMVRTWIMKKDKLGEYDPTGQNTTPLPILKDAEWMEKDSGHFIMWEEGFEDWITYVIESLKDNMRFTGCFLEPVNHYTIGVYEV